MKIRSWRSAVVLAVGVLLGTGACMKPRFESPSAVEGWDTSYPEALSAHSQLALGLLEALKEGPEQLQSREVLSKQWAELARLVQAKAGAEQVDTARQGIERELDAALVGRIKSKKYRQADLLSFMMNSGMKPPSGGLGQVNPDHMVATHLAGVLAGTAAPAREPTPIELVTPDQVLSPAELLALGTAVQLAEERESFEMPQVFRLALYFRPLRRMYDPKVTQTFDARQEAVYLDRIWRVLRPEQVAWIRRKAFSRKDMEAYLKKHAPMYQVDPQRHPTFALLEYTVNDFHEQIAPKEQVARENGKFYIPASLRASKDGKALFEGICSGCHGMDGQGRFPPISAKSYLSLHSDNEHFEIVRSGPPQKKGSSVVMPAFGQEGLSEEQMWNIVRYLRAFEEKADSKPRGEDEAKKAGVRFYSAQEVRERWEKKDPTLFLLDAQSDIAYRIMGHIPGSTHIVPEELDARLGELPKDKEIIVIDMFGSQGIPPATRLAGAGYKVGYMRSGMSDWHITQNYTVLHGSK